jgi:hypothetical protein
MGNREKDMDAPLVDAHELGHESLEMENDLGAHPNAMFVESSPFDNLGLQSVVQFGEEFEG